MLQPDFFSRVFQQAPYPTYARLREEAPICWSSQLQSWLISRHADVVALTREVRLSAQYSDSLFLGLPEHLDRGFERFRVAYRSAMIFSDDPLHGRLRTHLHTVYTPAFVDGLRRAVSDAIDELLAPHAAAGHLDLRGEFAALLPARVIAAQLGAPQSDGVRFVAWGEALLRFLGRGPDDVALAEATLARYEEMATYFAELVAAARAHGGDNLLAPLVRPGSPADELTDDELLMMCLSFLIAGIETTANMICNATWLVGRRPEVAAALAETPSLAASLTEETLRYESPVQLAYRVAREPLILHETPIAAGERVIFLLGAANRDERVFETAERFDPGREGGRHIAFGYGVHFCTGAMLARHLCRASLEALFVARSTRVPERVEWCGNLLNRGVNRLDVSWS